MNELRGRDELTRAAEAALAMSEAEETEVALVTGTSYLTRFAKNVIHQNVGSRGANLLVRTVTDKHVGVAQAENFDPETMRATLGTAQAMAAVRPALEDFRHLPKPGRKMREVEAWDEATAQCTPEQRAEIVAALVAKAKKRRGEAAGVVETQAREIVVVNSRGVRAYHRQTSVEFDTVVTCGDGSGWAGDTSYRLGDLAVDRVIRDGVGKAWRSRRPESVEAGEWDVVLEPEAVGILVAMLGYVAFGGKAYQEGRSPLSGKVGQTVTGDTITIVDNAYHAKQRGMPFDWEGVPRKRVKLIEKGVARGVVWDSYLAGREKGRQASTGHAIPPSMASYGAMPGNLVMDGGGASLKKLVAETKRGLLVTRLHYVNVVERMESVLTGMTRDGTFRIEDGRAVAPVRNLRFTESVLGAFGRAEGLTRERRIASGALVPGMRIRGFRFTGKTEF